MENRVRIENPCRENWNLMSQNKKGKFCNSCNQTVVDFRKMMHSDIQKYFVENKNNESICGYYKSNQVENKINIKLNYVMIYLIICVVMNPLNMIAH